MAAVIPIWYADQAQAFALGLRGRENKLVTLPRMPTDTELLYDTQHYVPFDYAYRNPEPPILRTYAGHGVYDEYALSLNQGIRSGHQLPAGKPVRLDDYGCYLAARDTDVRALYQSFGSEFDRYCNIRATRVPLGNAAKKFCDVGDVDMDGKIVEFGEHGWYYLWWRGIHLLCGREGLQAGMYRVRAANFERSLPGTYFGVYQYLVCVLNDHPSMGGLIVDRWILLEEIL